jgi:hypothetical protein
MADRDEQRLERQFQRFKRRLPGSISRFMQCLSAPSSRWVRLPVAVVLICGGLFGFLPALGLWMLPLGFLLLAQDLPFLRKPTRQALVCLERCWVKWKIKRRGRR